MYRNVDCELFKDYLLSSSFTLVQPLGMPLVPLSQVTELDAAVNVPEAATPESQFSQGYLRVPLPKRVFVLVVARHRMEFRLVQPLNISK